MRIRSLTAASIATTSILAVVTPSAAQAAPASITCVSSPDVGKPSTAGGVFGTAPVTFPSNLVQGWDLGSGHSRGALSTASARMTQGDSVLNLVEVGRLRVSSDSHDTAAIATIFSLCRFQNGDSPQAAFDRVSDRQIRPVTIGGVKGSRLDVRIPHSSAEGSDSFRIIVLDTSPVSYFLGGASTTNTEALAKVDAVLRALRVR